MSQEYNKVKREIDNFRLDISQSAKQIPLQKQLTKTLKQREVRKDFNFSLQNINSTHAIKKHFD